MFAAHQSGMIIIAILAGWFALSILLGLALGARIQVAERNKDRDWEIVRRRYEERRC